MLRIYLVLVIIGGALTLWSFLQIPIESENVIILGLSKERLVIAFGVVSVIVAALGVLFSSWIKKSAFTRFQEKLIAKLQHRTTWGWVILICFIGFLFGSYLTLLTPEITEPFTLAYFERLQPLILWFSELCAQTLLILPFLRYGLKLRELKPPTQILYQVAGVMGFFLILWLLIAITGLGLTASDAGAGWNYLGSPVMETQAFIAWIVGIAYLSLALWGENHPGLLKQAKKLRFLTADLVFSILIWLVAFISWNSIPLMENWFAAPPGIPNQAFYPNSDASLYDTTGQTLLTGMGFKTYDTPFAIRPMYALFLATLHSLAGVDYEPIIWMQVAVLAIIPVLMYWITLQLHNRVSAIIVSVLIIFREANAIILGNAITTSHAKLLMSDLPTTLGVMLFIFLMIRWLQKPEQRQTLTLIVGGVTGIFMLIRPEFGVLLFFTGFAAWLQLIRQPKVWIKGMVLAAAGILLMLTPWVWRNYQITGTLFLDSPHYRADLFAVRYREYLVEETPTSSPPEESISLTATSSPEQPQATATPKVATRPGESSGEFAERMAQVAAQYIQKNPGAVVAFISNHFFNSQVQTVLYLPDTWRLPDSAVGFIGHKDFTRFWEECCSADNYIRRLPFWFKWDGTIMRQSFLFIFMNLFLLSVGLTTTWRRQRFIALLPLAANLGYSLINAIVRNSGGRYILAVDWIGMLYYAIGLGQLTLWLVAYFRGSKISTQVTGEMQFDDDAKGRFSGFKAYLAVALGIFVIGCILPLSEKIIPMRFPAELLTERYEALLQSKELSQGNLDILTGWAQSGGSVIQGRALYPRFHPANEGEVGDSIRAFMPASYSKVDFYLIGPYNHGIVIPQETAPKNFPNGADIVAIGCPGIDYFEALIVVVYDEQGDPIDILPRQPFPEVFTCPLPAP